MGSALAALIISEAASPKMLLPRNLSHHFPDEDRVWSCVEQVQKRAGVWSPAISGHTQELETAVFSSL